MIAFIDGKLDAYREGLAILDVNGVGYQAFITNRDLGRLPSKGERVRLYTYLSVREDAMQLFGFLDPDDLEVFKLLIGVNGIGPKAGLGVLSALSADELRFAVLSEDEKTILRAPGIGKKTAQKMILELKDKISLEDAVEKRLDAGEKNTGAAAISAAAVNDAVLALVELGYSNAESLKAVKSIEGAQNMGVEEILKLALRQLI